MPRNTFLRLHVARQLHSHENPAAPEADDHRCKPYELQHHPVEPGGGGVVGLVQDDHARPTQGEHEAASQPLHDVLPVHPVGHEGHGPGVAMLVCGAAHARRLHDHIVNNSTCDHEVGEKYECKDGPWRGGLNPGGFLYFEIWHSQHTKNRSQDVCRELFSVGDLWAQCVQG